MGRTQSKSRQFDCQWHSLTHTRRRWIGFCLRFFRIRNLAIWMSASHIRRQFAVSRYLWQLNRIRLNAKWIVNFTFTESAQWSPRQRDNFCICVIELIQIKRRRLIQSKSFEIQRQTLKLKCVNHDKTMVKRLHAVIPTIDQSGDGKFIEIASLAMQWRFTTTTWVACDDKPLRIWVRLWNAIATGFENFVALVNSLWNCALNETPNWEKAHSRNKRKKQQKKLQKTHQNNNKDLFTLKLTKR